MLFFQIYFIGQPTTGIVFRSADAGQTWQDVSAGLPDDLKVRSIFSNHGEFLLPSDRGLYHSRHPFTIPAWEKENLLNTEVAEIFPGMGGPYASYYEKGLFQELPGTGIWVQKYPEFKKRMVLEVVEIPGGSFFIACDNGIFRSDDGGKSWKHVFVEDGVMSLVEVDGVLIGSGFRNLLRSTDNGAHWEKVEIGEWAPFHTALIEDGVVAITFGRERDDQDIVNRLLFSADRGKTWERMDKGLPSNRRIYDIEQAGGYLFCSLDTGIYRSSDHGKTWELVRPVKGGKRFELAVFGQSVYAVLVDVMDGC
ncbi:MAG: exo-alpha-sialidase [Saprospirales bacterium]|nr:exo-alpha-sialidase [Saprospirales bacterium]